MRADITLGTLPGQARYAKDRQRHARVHSNAGLTSRDGAGAACIASEPPRPAPLRSGTPVRVWFRGSSTRLKARRVSGFAVPASSTTTKTPGRLQGLVVPNI